MFRWFFLSLLAVFAINLIALSAFAQREGIHKEDYVGFPNVKPIDAATVVDQITPEIRNHVNLDLQADVKYFSDRATKVLMVVQGTFAILKPDEKKYSYIASAGAGPCINLVLYDPVSKIVALTHLSPGTDYVDTITAIQVEAGPSFKPTRAVMASQVARFGKYSDLEALMMSLIDYGVEQIEYIKSETVVMDRSGGVYSNSISTYESRSDAGYPTRVQLHLVPGEKLDFVEETILKGRKLRQGPCDENYLVQDAD